MSSDASFANRYDRPRRISWQDMRRIVQEQDVEDRTEIEFVCPACGTVQTAQDLIDAGAGPTLEEVIEYLAFSCVGRFDEERGCDWTLGGLLQIHDLEVVHPEEGKSVPRFLPVNFEEAMEGLGIEEVERPEEPA